MDDKQLQKLIRQNAAKVAKANKAMKDRSERQFDQTLPPGRSDDEDLDRRQFFNEMKRREF
jgi:hypothetical protein